MLNERVLCVITGASRGYGRCLAQALAKVVRESSLFVLLSRDTDGLNETRSLLERDSPNVRVLCRSVDLSTADGKMLTSLLGSLRAEIGDEKYERGLLLHNAGSVGDVSKPASRMNDRDELMNYFSLNIVSPVLLTSAYFETLKSCVHRHLIINVSSLLAVQPIASLSMYATGKAAREMYFRSLAVEEGKDVRVLNWAPGPMETALVTELTSTSFDSGTKQAFKKMHFVSMPFSAEILIKIISEDNFEDGAHIDIFDVASPDSAS